MPKITIEPSNRGLFQETGSVVVGAPESAQTVSGGAIATTGFVVPITAASGGQNGTLDAGTADGQLIILMNVGSQDIQINATNFAGSAVDLVAGESVLCVWDGTNSQWSPTSQTMS